jgi:predicted transcriptional regulator
MNNISDIVSNTLEEMLKSELLEIDTDESGEFYFSLSDKGKEIAEEIIENTGDNNA